jgi:tetratricopeptide (TPR) repeat protein
MIALAPVTGPSEPATESLDLVRERVLGTLAAALDFRAGSQAWPMQPRSLEVYRVFRQGQEALWGGGGPYKALPLFREAWAMDSTFYPALVRITLWVYWLSGFAGGDSLGAAEADSLARLVDRYRDRMSEVERLSFQLLYHGDLDGPEARLRTGRRLAELTPWYTPFVGVAALESYRPREALERFARVDTANSNYPLPSWFWPATAQAHHLLQHYEEELEIARAVRRERPDDLRLIDLRLMDGYLRPLAALGRIEALTTLLDTVFALPFEERGPLGFLWTPHRRAGKLAAELRAHGYGDAARSVLQRTVDWLETRSPEEERRFRLPSVYRYALAECLYKLERWEEARAVYEELLAEGGPQDTLALAGLGAIAARSASSLRGSPEASRWAEPASPRCLGSGRRPCACCASPCARSDLGEYAATGQRTWREDTGIWTWSRCAATPPSSCSCGRGGREVRLTSSRAMRARRCILRLGLSAAAVIGIAAAVADSQGG